MTLEIDLGGADPALAIPGLQKALFFQDLKLAMDALPYPVSDLIPFEVGDHRQRTCKDCVTFFDNGVWNEIPKVGANSVLPTVVHVEQPEYTETARSSRVSGVVIVTVFVNSTGAVEDLWLARPLGFGLDGQAEAAVRKYRFRPAEYKGHAVGVELGVEVNFQIFRGLPLAN